MAQTPGAERPGTERTRRPGMISAWLLRILPW